MSGESQQPCKKHLAERRPGRLTDEELESFAGGTNECNDCGSVHPW